MFRLFENWTRRQKTTFIVIAIVDFFNAVCISIQAPFYPQVAEKKGAVATEYGLVFGIFELVVFITSPIFGAYINKIGTWRMFSGGLLITGGCVFCFGFLDFLNDRYWFITLSFLIRIVEAVGDSAFLTASFSIIAGEFPDQVTSMFANLELFFGLGLIAGPPIGGLFFDLGGFILPFTILGFCLTAAAIFSLLCLPRNNEKIPDASGWRNIFELYSIWGFVLAAMSICATSMSIGFLQATLEPYVRPFGLNGLMMGFIFIINGGVYAAATPLVGYICEQPRVVPKYITMIGCAHIALAFLIIGPAPFFGDVKELWITIIGLVIHGLGMTFQLVAAFGDAHKTALDNGKPNSLKTHGQISGMWASAFALGAFIGPTISGILYDQIGFKNSTLFVSAIHVIMMIVDGVYLCCSRRPDPSLQQELVDTPEPGSLDDSAAADDDAQLTKNKSSRRSIVVRRSRRPPGMTSAIICSSFERRRVPWANDTGRYQPFYGSIDYRFNGAVSIT